MTQSETALKQRNLAGDCAICDKQFKKKETISQIYYNSTEVSVHSNHIKYLEEK